MYSSCLLVLALTVYGATAAPCMTGGCGLWSSGPATTCSTGPTGCCGNAPATFGATGPSAGCSPAIQGPTTFLQTGVIEGANTVIPSVVPPTSVSRTCHCLKTFVRPQLRTEVITVPIVDHLSRVVNNPVIEVMTGHGGGHNRYQSIPTCVQPLCSSFGHAGRCFC